jgi:hypothetical protein
MQPEILAIDEKRDGYSAIVISIGRIVSLKKIVLRDEGVREAFDACGIV